MASQGQSRSGTQQLKLTYMGKPFYGGVNSSVPETEVDTNESPFIQNCIIRRGEVRSRFNIGNIFPAPNDGSSTRGLTCFYDLNAVMHTVALTRQFLYQLSVNWPQMLRNSINPWLSVAALGQGQPDNVYATAILQENLIFTNGGSNIFGWNGMTNSVYTLDKLANGTTFGAFFLMELNAQLVAAYTIETLSGTTNFFPFRVRWSAVGGAIFPPNVNAFDPSVNLAAGLNDELDVPDIITGIGAIGMTGYIYRNNGISEMLPNPQGSGFNFNHLWASDRGIGNVFPQTLAMFGPMHIFVADDNIYQITPNSFNSIGGKAFDAIATDLANTPGLVEATIVPMISRGYPYNIYWLLISQGNNTFKHWIYDIREQSWTSWLTNGKNFTCKPRLVFIG